MTGESLLPYEQRMQQLPGSMKCCVFVHWLTRCADQPVMTHKDSHHGFHKAHTDLTWTQDSSNPANSGEIFGVTLTQLSATAH